MRVDVTHRFLRPTVDPAAKVGAMTLDPPCSRNDNDGSVEGVGAQCWLRPQKSSARNDYFSLWHPKSSAISVARLQWIGVSAERRSASSVWATD